MKKYEEAQQLTLLTIPIVNEGDKEALKLIKFVKATNSLPLPSPESEEERRKQVTFNVLNMTPAGTGAIQVKILEETHDLTSESVYDLTLQPFCCSGKEHCIVQKTADPKIHTCPICKKAVHAVCGIPNPDFINDKVGFKFSTICHLCANPKVTLSAVQCKPVLSRKGIAYKRPDGQWNVCIGNEEAFFLSHDEIMDESKYFVTALGSTLTSKDSKRQARKMKR